jgi:hypothetical protein
MKDKLIEMLIEARGKREFYRIKHNNSFWLNTKWEPLMAAEDAKILEITRQLRDLGVQV